MTPQEYETKYKLKPIAVAYEHCMTEVGYRHRNDLLDIKLPEFEWYFFGKGYDYKSLEAVNQYAQLVKTMGRARAKDTITKHMEEFWRDHDKKNR